MKIVRSLTNCYNKLSNFGKILLFIALLLVVVVFFRTIKSTRESFAINQINKQFLFTKF